MAELWVSYPDLAETIGHEEAQNLCRNHGGLSVYVPRQADAESPLGRLLPEQARNALCRAYGGLWISIPNRRREPNKRRILERLSEGETGRAIAADLGVTERYVRRLASTLARL